MTATTPVRQVSAAANPARERRHRLCMWAGAIAAIAVSLALAGYGFDYYILPAARRVAAPKHATLRPSGTVGHTLGIAGGVMLLLMYLYPLRKRWKWLNRRGKSKHWLDWHILLGLTAPVILTFHSAFKFRGIAGVAYWTMMMVVASGIVGRYLYRKIPRKLDQVEMSIEETAQECAGLARQMEERNILDAREVAALLSLPRIEEVRKMPLLQALGAILWLDLRRPWLLLRLRRASAAHVTSSAELAQALALVRKQSSLSVNALFLSRVRQLFHLWHVVHRPFSYAMAICAALHVLVVVFLGYF